MSNINGIYGESNTESKRDASRFIYFMGILFVAVSFLTAWDLLRNRLIWAARVRDAISSGCLSMGCGFESVTPVTQGFLRIETGDACLFLYIPLSMFMGVLLWIYAGRLGHVKLMFLFALVGMGVYSVWAFFHQIGVEREAVFPGSLLELKDFVYHTSIAITLPRKGDVVIFDVGDPHTVTFYIAVVGLMLLLDRFSAARMWRWLSRYYKYLPGQN